MKLRSMSKRPPAKDKGEVAELIKKFENSDSLYTEVVLNKKEKEVIDHTYNSLYQACKRNKQVKVRRCYGRIYLVKIDENGEEL